MSINAVDRAIASTVPKTPQPANKPEPKITARQVNRLVAAVGKYAEDGERERIATFLGANSDRIGSAGRDKLATVMQLPTLPDDVRRKMIDRLKAVRQKDVEEKRHVAVGMIASGIFTIIGVLAATQIRDVRDEDVEKDID